MNYQNLGLHFEERIARLTLARPADSNRIDLRLLRELDDAVATVAADSSVLVTIIDADGPNFCEGWDQDALEELAVPRPHAASPFDPIAGLGCVTVAALHGRVASAGLELALACDIRLCSDDTTFAMPEVSEGRLPFGGATQRLPRLIGKARALDMLLAGTEFDADEAYRCGLVSRVVPRTELSEAVSTLADRIADRGPLALQYAKEAAYRGLEMPLEQALRYETDLSVILQTTADRAEGVRAFFEKRPPRFEGR